VSWSETDIIDNGVDQWHRHLHSCIWATGGPFGIFTDKNLSKC